MALQTATAALEIVVFAFSASRNEAHGRKINRAVVLALNLDEETPPMVATEHDLCIY